MRVGVGIGKGRGASCVLDGHVGAGGHEELLQDDGYKKERGGGVLQRNNKAERLILGSKGSQRGGWLGK